MMGSRREQGVRGKVQQKQQARRAEIVVAAQKCFAEGAARRFRRRYRPGSGPSVGQLYRIFASKEAIIEAIVSEIVNARVGEMIDDNDNLARKAAVLVAGSRRRQPLKAIIIC